MRKILFVCTGNTCRSPMAAAIFNKLLRENNINDITAESAGLNAYEGQPASENAVKAVYEAGADLSAHRARRVSRAIVGGCEAIYTMSSGPKSMLEAVYPDFKGRVHILGGGISDPFGGDIEDYRQCRDELAAALQKMLKDYINDAEH